MAGDDLVDLLRKIGEKRRDLMDERTNLISQREVLNGRLAEIDKALRALPENAASVAESLEPPAHGDEVRNAPEIVLDILRATPDLNGPQIVEAGNTVRTFDAPTWYAALYRLEKRGDIVSSGTRGSRTYRATREVGSDT